MSMTIYCEGNKRSHDYDIIHKTVKDKAVQIQPIGSKNGAENFIEACENEKNEGNAFIFFRDRDFDVPVPEKPSLTKQGYTFYSYRTTIENYLFDVNTFFAFLEKKKLNKTFKLHNREDVQKVFIKAAKKISYYQALRHTMAQLRDSVDLGTSWLKGNSGSLPYLLADKTSCRQKAWDKVVEMNVQTENFTESMFDAILDTFNKRFENDNFYLEAQYLIWFQGKDFAKSLSLTLPQFPMVHYYKFAKQYLDYRQFEDFVELREVIEARDL
jgi:Protein of unknown function (DUF4435)